jgi:hypothetical protein
MLPYIVYIHRFWKTFSSFPLRLIWRWVNSALYIFHLKRTSFNLFVSTTIRFHFISYRTQTAHKTKHKCFPSLLRHLCGFFKKQLNISVEQLNISQADKMKMGQRNIAYLAACTITGAPPYSPPLLRTW